MERDTVLNFLFILFLLVFIQHFQSAENIEEQIFDSSEGPLHAYPWMVSIRLNFLSLIKRDCEGVIISDSFILTAASCFSSLTTFTPYFIIKAGLYQIGGFSEATEQVRSVSQLIPHPNYTYQFFLNDLALIRIAPPFRLDQSSVYSINFSNLTSVENINLTTIGWGGSTPGVLPIPLKQVIVQENIECTQTKLNDPNTQLCASGTCEGDTGGPLMVYSKEDQQYELVGITSYRDACVTDGLFTRIVPFVDWILTVLDTAPPTPPPQSTMPFMVSTTTPPEVLGPPIPFVCNTSYPCGCSSVPVVFHDEFFESPVIHASPLQITGGETAQPHSWSWAVSLRKPLLGHFCGGSLIDDQWILTAAHCSASNSTLVHIGVQDEKSPSPQIRQVVEVIVHPDFIPAPKFLNDIALLRISPAIDFQTSSAYAAPICLPPEGTKNDYPKADTRLAVIGWGQLVFGGPRSTKLRQVRVKTLNNLDWRCAASIFDAERQFCAMVDGGGKDSCQGDSGGPIHRWLDDHWEQVGIVSFGTDCGLANYPGMYTRLSFYIDWIQSHVNTINETTDAPLCPTERIFTSETMNGSFVVDNFAVVHNTKLSFYVILCVVGLRFFFLF